MLAGQAADGLHSIRDPWQCLRRASLDQGDHANMQGYYPLRGKHQ